MASAKKIKKEQSEDEAQLLANAGLGRSERQRKSWTAALVSMSTRVAVWYALITVIFICPGSLDQLKAQSSPVCKPYLHFKSYASPYLAPYYHTYAAPYVDAARPYAEKIHTTLYQPTFAYAKLGYERYGAPSVALAQENGQKEWARVIRPRLDSVQNLVLDRYDASLGPYVNHAQGVVSPYYTTACDTAIYQYQNTVRPTYNKALPYAASAYNHSYAFVTKIVLPYLQKSSEIIYIFITRRIWPPIRVLYGENVQPQLFKIRERLTNYRDAKAIESVMESMDVNSSRSVASQSSVLAASSSSSPSSSTSSPKSALGTVKPELEPTQPMVKKSLGAELEDWKEKFARASKKGTEDLKSHVAELTISQIEAQARGTGNALIVQLEEVTDSSLRSLKKSIVSIVAALPESESDEDEQRAIEASHDKVRFAGRKIKEVAQKLRTWKVSYLEKTEDLVRDATENTLDVIDHIRELGLQEIGMRYAHEEDATHKEWREYHALKKTFDTWREDISNAGLKHAGLTTAIQAGEDVEARGMAVAEDAAKELARLKSVVLWKIRAKDTTDDFSTRAIPAAATRAKEIVAEKLVDLREAIVGTSQDNVESIASVAADSSLSLIDVASTTVADFAGAISSSASSAANVAPSSVSSAHSAASESLSSQIPQVGKDAQSSMSTATVHMARVASSASEAIASVAEAGASTAASARSILAESAESVADIVSSAAAKAGVVALESADEASGNLVSATSILESTGSDTFISAQSAVESASSRANEAVSLDASSPLSKAKGAVVSAASAVNKEVSSAAVSFEEEAGSTLSEASQSLASAASKVRATISPGGYPLSNAASDMVADPAQSASSSIPSIVGDAIGSFKDTTSSLVRLVSSASSKATESASSASSRRIVASESES